VNLTGPAKAAAFLLSLDKDKTVHIIEHLKEQEVRKLREAIEDLAPIPVNALEEIYGEFNAAYKRGWTSMHDGTRYLQDLVREVRGDEMAVRWFAPEKAEDEVEEGHPDEDALRDEAVGELSGVDPSVLRFSLSEEHPQIAAAVLAHLEPIFAAEVLADLDQSLQADLIHRVSVLEPIPVSAVADAAKGLKGVDVKWLPSRSEVDGVNTAASILNSMAGDQSSDLVARLAEEHPEEAAKIQRAMFTLEDLIDADQRGLQQLLKEVQTDHLLVALKTASDPLREKLFACMSKRAAAMLEEEAELLPAMPLREVEAAQDQIVEIAMRLIGEGKLAVKGRGEELV
jgi:flagellar motor switch protein FliG